MTAIIVAAGCGSRFGGSKNKLLFEVHGKTIIEHTLAKFVNHEKVDDIILVYAATDFTFMQQLAAKYKNIKLVEGGSARYISVQNALNQTNSDIVLIHDGARPFVTHQLISDCILGAENFGSGIAACAVTDTLVIKNNCAYPDRSSMLAVQTPQCFNRKQLIAAYNAVTDFSTITDDSTIFSKVASPHFVTTDTHNYKITTYQDIKYFDMFYDVKTGVGIDTHIFCNDRQLILGGIKIASSRGLLGHSDADALTHAIMDALLSAASLRDIGYHFPDTDSKYKNADSTMLLREVLKKLYDKKISPSHISAVIMCDQPKLKNYIQAMQDNLAQHLGCTVAITATTTERTDTEKLTVWASCVCLSQRQD